MKKILMALAIATSMLTAHAQDWKTITLIDKVTISMPGTPTEDKSKGIPMQKVVLSDSSEINAGIVDYSVFGLDEEKLQAMAGTEDFKQQMEGAVSAQPGITVIKNESGKYADKYYTFDMTLQRDADGKKSTVYTRLIFFKQYSINIGYMPGIKGENQELKNKVFSGVKIVD